jgi:hypothetical protein
LAAIVDITVNTTLGDTDVRIGGGYNISGGIVLTINGAFSAPLTQIFFGAGTVVFGPSSVPAVYPEWWGIDGTADDVQIQAALAAAVNVRKVALQYKVYNLNAGLTITTYYMQLEGIGGKPFLTTAADIDVITVSANQVILKNFYIHATGAHTLAGLKFIDGGKGCSIYDVSVYLTHYGIELYSANATGVAYNKFYGCLSACNANGYECYIHHTGAPAWVNENNFHGCGFQGALALNLLHIASDTNNNKFIGCNFEAGTVGNFAVVDKGMNRYYSCRMEVSGYGFNIENYTGGWATCGVIDALYWGGVAPMIAVTGTDSYSRVQVHNCGTFVGGWMSGTKAATTVDAASAAAQKVLNVAATTGFNVGDAILINSGGARQEWNEVATIQAGVSLTLVNNLAYLHTLAQADAVAARGLRYGVNYRAYNMFDTWTHGILVSQIDNAGNLKTLGTMTASTTLTP